jgi:hypothetical protein
MKMAQQVEVNTLGTQSNLETFEFEKFLAGTIGTVGLVLPFDPFIQFSMHPCSSISGTLQLD